MEATRCEPAEKPVLTRRAKSPESRRPNQEPASVGSRWQGCPRPGDRVRAVPTQQSTRRVARTWQGGHRRRAELRSHFWRLARRAVCRCPVSGRRQPARRVVQRRFAPLPAAAICSSRLAGAVARRPRLCRRRRGPRSDGRAGRAADSRHSACRNASSPTPGQHWAISARPWSAIPAAACKVDRHHRHQRQNDHHGARRQRAASGRLRRRHARHARLLRRHASRPGHAHHSLRAGAGHLAGPHGSQRLLARRDGSFQPCPGHSTAWPASSSTSPASPTSGATISIFTARLGEYRRAKARLFEHLRPGGLVVLNADDPVAAQLRRLARSAGADRRH